MTVPAVAPRWGAPGPDPGLGPLAPGRRAAGTAPVSGRVAPVGRAADGPTGRAAVFGPGVPVPCGGARAPTIGSVLRDRLVGVRRVAPLGAVFLTGLMLQAAVAPHIAVRGSAADVLLVGVAAVAVGRGPRAGAGFGFAAGLGADLFVATPLGTSALAFTLVGHGLGQWCRPRPSDTAAALCSPASTCFACRTGRRHRPERVAARRATVRRSIALTASAVVAGRLGTAVVATALGGLPFPGAVGLLRIVAVAAVSAPLGPAVFAAVRRLPGAAATQRLGGAHTGRRRR